MNRLKTPINPVVEKQIRAFVNSPSNSLLLYGEKGIGKSLIAHRIATELLNESPAYDGPKIETVNFLDVKSSIDEIRQLRSNIYLKSSVQVDKVYVFFNFDSLSLPAYNSFLKTLEEPPVGICFLLCVSEKSKVPITVLSRVKNINITKPSHSALINYLKIKYPNINIDDIERIYQVNSGLPEAIETDLSKFNSKDDKILNLARDFFSINGTEKLILINDLYKSKTESILFLKMVKVMSEAAIKNNSTNRIWQKAFESSLKAIRLIEENSQSRLVLLNFVNEII